MHLPEVLAGPLLRRAEPERVLIWLATSSEAMVTCAISTTAEDGGPADLVGSGDAETVRLGARLFVHLCEVRPHEGRFPVGELLSYDVGVTTDSGTRDLEHLGLVDGEGSLAYPGLQLPTFYLSDSGDIRFLHGSCHRMHGTGDDALSLGDELISATPRDLADRPSALFLTGDQIYADSVAGCLIGWVNELADELMGYAESIPGIPELKGLGVNGRSGLCGTNCALTSADCANHLMSFGEYAAMYLLTWNPQLWPHHLPTLKEALGPGLDHPVRRLLYLSERKETIRVLPTLHKVRRLLANVPTYMMFDDHDITDDWNLTQQWKARVQESVSGRRIIANGLAAAWAFQMWGNETSVFHDAFKHTIVQHLMDPQGTGHEFDDALWAFSAWSFYAPTSPPVIVLDTRSQRAFDGYTEPPRLIGGDELKRVKILVQEAGIDQGDPLIMVSPVPVYELPLWEGPQKYVAYAVGPYEIDLEAWRSNMAGFVDFMTFIVDDIKPDHVVFLSGDVHYSYSMNATFSNADGGVPVAQLTSSATKNSMAFTRYAVRPLALMLHKSDTRFGWETEPDFGRSVVRRRWLKWRESNIEGGTLDGPVWLTPKRAVALHPDAPPDFVETRTYVRVSHVVASPVMGKNNLGLVTMREGGIMHELLTQSDGPAQRFTGVLQSHPRGEQG